MLGSRRATAAAALLALVVLQVAASPAAQAQAYIAGPWFEFNETAGVLTVNAKFYSVTINLTRGFTIQSLVVKYAGEEVEAAEAARYLPSMLVYAYSNLSEVEPGSAVVEVRYDNKTYTTNYPGFLATRPWEAEVVYNDSDVLVVHAQPTARAAVDINPAELDVYVTFYRNLPLIEYRFVFSNPSNQPLEIYSIEYEGVRYGPIIEVVAGDAQPPSWNQSIVYVERGGGLGFVNLKQPQYDFRVEEGSRVASVALVKVDGGPKYLVAAEPVTQPGLIQLLRGYVGEVKDPIRARMAFDLLRLGPGESREITVNLAVAWGDPGSMALAGLSLLALKLYGPEALGVYEYNKTISDLQKNIEELKAELNATQSELEKARDRARELEAKAGELEGLLGLCRADLNATKARMAAIKAAAERTAFTGIASFIIGVAMGIVGYRIAGVQELLETLRKARRHAGRT